VCTRGSNRALLGGPSPFRRQVKHALHVLLAALAVVGCNPDVVSSHYATLAQARADQLFDRGWLPDLLPPSAYDIHTSNDVAQNTSVGEFHFVPAEFPLLEARLQPFASAEHHFNGHFDHEIRAYVAAGRRMYQYTENGSTWVFLCNSGDGRCEYTMWLWRRNLRRAP